MLLCLFFLLFFREQEQLSPTDEILILDLDIRSSFWGNLFIDGFYRRKTGRVLKNMKMKDPNVVEIDLLFLFVFVSVLCVWIRTNVGFLVKKTLVLGGTNKKQCGVRRFLIFSRGGETEFSTLVADLSTTKDLSGARDTVLSFVLDFFFSVCNTQNAFDLAGSRL